MTTEEAIAYWEVFQREIDLLYPLCDERSKATLGEQREPVALALSALRTQKQAEANKPLTLDELREMGGEPVYIAENQEYWAVVNGFDERGIYLLSYGNPDDYGYFELYGKTWLAYRHKPKEA